MVTGSVNKDRKAGGKCRGGGGGGGLMMNGRHDANIVEYEESACTRGLSVMWI